MRPIRATHMQLHSPSHHTHTLHSLDPSTQLNSTLQNCKTAPLSFSDAAHAFGARRDKGEKECLFGAG